MKTRTTLIAMTFAAAAALWTAAGETSDPMLNSNELPTDIVTSACNPSVVTDATGTCQIQDYANRWIGKTAKGDLFVVMGATCAADDGCRAWLVEKSGMGISTLLAMNGKLHLRRGANAYPVVETHTEISALNNAYSRFEWNGVAYARTGNTLLYKVDGNECGTREECSNVARKALQHQNIDRAVKIWENVHGVSWI
ncbi:MAG: hypothetical protein AAB134_01345 [Pseudomonadota bacterium]